MYVTLLTVDVCRYVCTYVCTYIYGDNARAPWYLNVARCDALSG